MKFHEDTIFKNQGQIYGQKLIEIVRIPGKIVKVHRTEYSILVRKCTNQTWSLNWKTR